MGETDLLKILDRRPLEMEFFDAAPGPASGIFLATSVGLLHLDLQARTAKRIFPQAVQAVVRDGARLMAAGSQGVFTEDAGWFRPVGKDPAVRTMTAPRGSGGALLASKTDLWQMSGDRAVHLLYDSAGLLGKPAASADEIAVIGFWALHRIRINQTIPAARPNDHGRSGAAGAPSTSKDMPLPAELRADVPLGVAYQGNSLVVIGRRSGVYVLSGRDWKFPPPIPPPPLDDAHLARGFPEGWIDFAVEMDNVYLMNADAALYQFTAGSAEPLRKISRWPDLDQPCRISLLPMESGRGDLSRHALLLPFSGNFVLHTDLAGDVPRKLNFLAASTGEILVREGLPATLFASAPGFSPASLALWAGAIVLFGVLAWVFYRRRGATRS